MNAFNVLCSLKSGFRELHVYKKVIMSKRRSLSRRSPPTADMRQLQWLRCSRQDRICVALLLSCGADLGTTLPRGSPWELCQVSSSHEQLRLLLSDSKESDLEWWCKDPRFKGCAHSQCERSKAGSWLRVSICFVWLFYSRGSKLFL